MRFIKPYSNALTFSLIGFLLQAVLLHHSLASAQCDAFYRQHGQTITRPFLFSIKKDGNTSYLFGTIHKGVDPIKRLPGFVLDALISSDTVVIETDLTKALDRDILIERGLMYSEGPSLKEQLSPFAWQRLVNELGDTHSLAELERLRPWVVENLLDDARKHESSRYNEKIAASTLLDETESMDTFIQDCAPLCNAKVTFLETREDSREAIDQTTTVEMLESHILNGLDIDAMILSHEQVILVYRSGNLERFEDFVQSIHTTDQRRVSLTNRNLKWMPLIQDFLRGETHFIAVGIAHLVGEFGLIRLLRDQGFEVNRVTKDSAPNPGAEFPRDRGSL